MRYRRVLVTGGAGFIGSHLVDLLMNEGAFVRIIDNLSSGTEDNIRKHYGKANFQFVRGDLLNPSDIKDAVKDIDIIFHLAANSEVRISSINPEIHYRQNVEATYNLLEAVRQADVSSLLFTSSSTVYGEAKKIPTPEDYAPLKPISMYGASKLAAEALISAYAYTYGFNAVIFRLANIVGPRSRRGVVYEFVQKLRENPRELEVLGDGTQAKSYLYVTDCIQAMLLPIERAWKGIEIYNVGSEDQIDVRKIAKIVIGELGLRDVKIRFTGGIDGGRGWKGDVKNMLLDVSKLRSLGWKPKYNSEEAVRLTVRELAHR